MTEAEVDQLAGEVFATPAGSRFLAYLDERGVLGAYFAAEIRRRLARMRDRWQT